MDLPSDSSVEPHRITTTTTFFFPPLHHFFFLFSQFLLMSMRMRTLGSCMVMLSWACKLCLPCERVPKYDTIMGRMYIEGISRIGIERYGGSRSGKLGQEVKQSWTKVSGKDNPQAP